MSATTSQNVQVIGNMIKLYLRHKMVFKRRPTSLSLVDNASLYMPCIQVAVEFAATKEYNFEALQHM